MATKLIFDTSTIISLAESCMINVLRNMAKQDVFDVVIPKGVEEEAVIRPIKIKRFALSALRVMQGIKQGWINVYHDEDGLMAKEIELFQSVANDLFFVEDEPIKILHKGETEIIALAKKLKSPILVMDERTTRMLLENPDGLMKFMRYKHKGETVKLDKERLKEFQSMVPDLKVIRSTELVALAFEKGFFKGELVQTKQGLEAALYAMKYSGCAVSFREIENYLKTVKSKK